MDPRGPSDFIVYYRQGSGVNGNAGVWDIERTYDGEVMASGSLHEMLEMINTDEYPNARRATWAEDMLRWKPGVFYMEYHYGSKGDE